MAVDAERGVDSDAFDTRRRSSCAGDGHGLCVAVTDHGEPARAPGPATYRGAARRDVLGGALRPEGVKVTMDAQGKACLDELVRGNYCVTEVGDRSRPRRRPGLDRSRRRRPEEQVRRRTARVTARSSPTPGKALPKSQTLLTQCSNSASWVRPRSNVIASKLVTPGERRCM